MSAEELYRELGLEGYRVEKTWRGEDGALRVDLGASGAIVLPELWLFWGASA